MSFPARILTFLGALLPLLPAAGGAAECVAHSGAQTPHLVELFTSEGCSSCPPAEAWLGGLDPQRTLGLAYHVDYWDDLGWPDALAQASFTARQQRLAARSGGGGIYTPEVALDGREWRAWSRAAPPALAPAPFALTLRVQDGDTLHAALDGLAPDVPLRVHFAWIENGLVRRIARGENAGRTLSEARAVRAAAGPFAPAAAQTTWTPPPGVVRAELGVVAWLTDADERVVQALERPLRGCD